MRPTSLYRFAGTEQQALSLQRRFVKFFDDAPGPIVDLGCGRGMFLTELKARGIPAIGVDGSSQAVTTCAERGIEIVQADALDYLSNHPDRFGGIFLSHVIEHLTPDHARNFFWLAQHSLKVGGRLVVVTPNVSDLWTMTEVFWLDITHVRPYPLPLLKEFCFQAGLQLIASGTQGLGWRAMSRRRILEYWWRRFVWGKQYGQTDAWIVAQR